MSYFKDLHIDHNQNGVLICTVYAILTWANFGLGTVAKY